MYYRITLALALLFAPVLLAAQSIDFVRQFSAGTSEFANATHADTDGNYYVTGYFGGSLSFGGQQLTGSGVGDVFFAKYNANGSLAWARSGTSSQWNGGRGIAVDGDGNAFVTGRIQGTASFDGRTVSSGGQNDPFVAKYSPTGAIQWVRGGQGAGDNWGSDVAATDDGITAAVGYFSGSINFNGNNLSSQGDLDNFIVSYGKDGAVRWARSAGGFGTESAYGVAFDSGGNAYVVGTYAGSATFGQITLDGGGGGTGFLVSYDPDGNERWAVRLEGTSVAEKVDVTESGRVYVTGSFTGNARFGNVTVSSMGQSDIFVAAFNTDGKADAAWAFGGSGDDGVAGFGQSVQVVATSDGGFTLGGSFEGTMTIGDSTLVSSGEDDVFVGRFDANGNPVWIRSGGGTAYEGFVSVGVDGSDNAFLFGNFFSPTFRFGTQQLFISGQTDMFLAKVATDGDASPTASITPISLAFGDVLIDNSKEKTITVRAENRAGLTVTGVSFVDPDAAAQNGFQLIAPDPGDLPADLGDGSDLQIRVEFAPTTLGDASATIQIESNDAETAVHTVPITGSGIDSSSLPIARVSIDTIDLGYVWLGQEADGTVTVSPGSSVALLVDDIDFTDPVAFTKGFELIAPEPNDLPKQLSAGESIDATVRFTSLDTGRVTTTLGISTNDPVTPTKEIVFIAIGAEQPIAQFSTFAIDFGSVGLESTENRSFTVSSANGTPLTIDTVMLENGAPYSIVEPDGSSGWPIVLEQGAELTVDIAFSPTVEGVTDDAVIVRTNDPQLPEGTVELTGEGTNTNSIANVIRPSAKIQVALSPNPVRQNGTVRIELRQGSDVQVDIIDIGGRHELTLYDGPLAPGTHTLEFNAARLTAGTYIVNVRSGTDRRHIIFRTR